MIKFANDPLPRLRRIEAVNRQVLHRAGFSRIDLLLVVAIVLLLFTLSMPAVSVMREVARQQQCQYRLRQLGVALLNYHDDHQVFPPAATWGSEGLDLPALGSHRDPTPIHVTRQNWIQLLLPHMGMTTLSQQFDPDRPVADERNKAARLTHVPALSCPSDTYNRLDNLYRMPLPEGTFAEFARGNYALNGGSDFVPAAFGTLANPGPMHSQYKFDEQTRQFSFLGSGISGINASLSIKDFQNGLGTFVGLEELRAGLSPADTRGVWALGQIGGSITWGHGVLGDDGAPNATEVNMGADDIRSGKQLYAELGRELIDGELMQACDHCDENVQVTARSKHSGGVYVFTLDGAVHFIANGVEPSVWHVMHSRGTPKELLEGNWAREIQPWDPQRNRPSGSTAANRSSISDLPDRVTNSVDMEFKKVPAGEFMMGLEDADFQLPFPSDAVPHQVRITQDYLLGVCEVTQHQYQAVMGSNPSWHTVENASEGELPTSDTSQWPVENISWNDAVEFCRRLSALPAETSARRTYRLPTEAEWEYACRGGRGGKISRPKWDEVLETGETGSSRPPKGVTLLPKAVRSYPPNGFGLFDMCGNVFEWTADYRRRDAYANSSTDDPTGPPTGYLRVIRGWHWVATGPNCKVYVANEPWVGNRFIGFRVVCVQE